MDSLNFNDGFKEFTINNDPDRVIRFSPTDVNIVERFVKAQKNIEQGLKDFQEEEKNTDEILSEIDEADEIERVLELSRKSDQIIFEQTDYIFDYPVSKAAYGNQSPLSSVRGKPLFERFMNAAFKHIQTEMTAEYAASAKRMDSYIGSPLVQDYKKKSIKKKGTR